MTTLRGSRPGTSLTFWVYPDSFDAHRKLQDFAHEARFDVAAAGMQLVERAPWIPQYGISYIVGVDGISLWILMLTTFIMPITIASTWSAVTKNAKGEPIEVGLTATGVELYYTD